MKPRVIALSALVSTVLLGTSLARAQSLGDLARQERERRSKSGRPAVKMLTNDDIPKAPATEERPQVSVTPKTDEKAAKEEQPSQSQAKAAAKEPATSTGGEMPAADKKTKEYWQGRFKPARAAVSHAEEEQQLAEDELNLLQIQQARELDPNLNKEFTQKVNAKQAEVDAKRAATAKTKQALEELEKQLKDSGAPEEWSKHE